MLGSPPVGPVSLTGVVKYLVLAAAALPANASVAATTATHRAQNRILTTSWLTNRRDHTPESGVKRRFAPASRDRYSATVRRAASSHEYGPAAARRAPSASASRATGSLRSSPSASRSEPASPGATSRAAPTAATSAKAPMSLTTTGLANASAVASTPEKSKRSVST